MEKVNAQVINPVSVKAYQGFINGYNKLPEDQRQNWLRLNKQGKFPCDNPVLYVAGNGDCYVLEVIPVWASSKRSIEVQGIKDAEKYYGQKNLLQHEESLYRKDLKLVVTYESVLWSNETINYQDDSKEFDYGVDDFLTRMKYIGLDKYFSHVDVEDSIVTVNNALTLLGKMRKSSVHDLVIYDDSKDETFKVSSISPFDLDEEPSVTNPLQVNFYSNEDDDLEESCLTVDDAIDYLLSIPREQRNLPLDIFDYSMDEDEPVCGIHLDDGQAQIYFRKYAKLPSKKEANSVPQKHYGINFDRLVELLDNVGNKDDEVYIDSYEELFNFKALQDEVDTFNDSFEDAPTLKCCQNKNNFDTYVYVDMEAEKHFSITKINNIIKEFCGRATWSEYSLHYESSDEYPISEDEFIKHSKKLVNEFLIHSF